MASSNTKSLPWILAVTSMVVLFLFVGYWNYSTYTREKKQLADDIEIQLQLAYTETKDSELVLFIQTQLSDTLTDQFFSDSISLFFDEHPMFSPFRKFKTDLNLEELETRNGDTTIIIDFDLNNHLTDPHNRKISGREITVVARSGESSDLSNFPHGMDSTDVRFDIQQININGRSDFGTAFKLYSDSLPVKRWHSSGDSFPTTLERIMSNDSSNIRFNSLKFEQSPGHNHTSVDKTFSLFKEKLLANNLPTEFKIVSDSKSQPDGLRVQYNTNEYGFSQWIVDVQNFNLFLLNKMSPTILFSLFLLGIIGLAFWTLLNNWLKQNRLVLVKNEFINNMTHELKTPIATVGVALEAISNFDLDTEKEKAKEYLEISRNEINRLSLLVDKVLNIAAFDAQDMELKSETIDVNEIIENTLSSLKLHLETNQVDLNYTNEANHSLVEGDQLHLRNIMHNLIDNAIKYSSDQPKIGIHLSELKDRIQLIVQDNGQGIPKEYQSKIFDKFFRVPTEDVHDVKGHGLGLSYVKNVIERFNGNISVESSEHEGSKFIITLPKSNRYV